MFVSTLDPIAFSIGPLSIRWYGLLFSIGFIIGYCIMQYFFRKKNYKTEDLDKLLVYIFVGTVLGARLAHCFIYEPDFYLKYPSRILMIWEGGLASHGGCLGVLIAVLLFLRKTGNSAEPSPYRKLISILLMYSIRYRLFCYIPDFSYRIPCFKEAPGRSGVRSSLYSGLYCQIPA